MLHSMFRQVDFALNDTLVTSSNDTYPYRAYMTTMLSYGEGSKKTFLEYLEYFYWDDHGEYDADSNMAISRKNLRTGNSKSTEVMGRLHVDMCMQERLLPNNITAKFTLYRNDPEFCLLGQSSTGGNKCQVVIEDASLVTRRVKLAAGGNCGWKKSYPAPERGTPWHTWWPNTLRCPVEPVQSIWMPCSRVKFPIKSSLEWWEMTHSRKQKSQSL